MHQKNYLCCHLKYALLILSLEQRKEQIKKENEELIKNMPDPDQPPGHRKLPDDEKEKTLTLLKDSKHKNFLNK